MRFNVIGFIANSVILYEILLRGTEPIIVNNRSKFENMRRAAPHIPVVYEEEGEILGFIELAPSFLASEHPFRKTCAALERKMTDADADLRLLLAYLAPM